MIEAPPPVLPKRPHLSRLMQLWRSGGWPCRDAVEIDLLAAGWVSFTRADSGHETLQLTKTGIQLLAAARLRNQRAFSRHDRLAERMAAQLMAAGRVVWRELSLRARIAVKDEGRGEGGGEDDGGGGGGESRHAWRIARPDVFSVRNTSLEAYLQPIVHEVKTSRADLLSDLRHAAKRESYQWLCCECFYVFPAGIAEAEEIPDAFGIWLLHGEVDSGRLELLRPARHQACTLPFAVWLALARATPLRADDDAAQLQLGAP